MTARGEAVRANAAKIRDVCSRCDHGEHHACLGGKKLWGGEIGTCSCKRAKHRLMDGICSAQVSSTWSSTTCCAPAVEKISIRAHFDFRTQAEVEVERCKFHASVARRVAKNEADRRAASELRRARDDEEGRARRSAEEWAERLRVDYGVETGTRGSAVTVAAERLYGQISAAVAILKDVVPDEENPFGPVGGSTGKAREAT